MPIFPVQPHELATVAGLVNSAYRGDSSRKGWTTEADLLGGQRTDPETLARDLDANPGARLLSWREAPGAEILGSVWVQPASGDVWYLGMLTVRPDLQAGGVGRRLLAGAEEACAALGARRMRMTVIEVRRELLAWYERRGYTATGDIEPFPMDDRRFGEPLRDDLRFLVLEKALATA